MARPRKSERDEMATTKIENAFWMLLETERYSDITVLRVSQESGTNRNSFYYHYRDMDDLAYQAFMRNARDEVSTSLISALLSAFQNDGKTPLEFNPSILQHSKRIMLCAGNDSLYLNRLVRDLLKELWFEAFSIKEELLTLEDSLQINFIFAGLVATLGSPEIKESPFSMWTLAQTEMGKSIIWAMKNISISQSK